MFNKWGLNMWGVLRIINKNMDEKIIQAYDDWLYMMEEYKEEEYKEEEYKDKLDDRYMVLAKQFNVEPRKLLSRVLEYGIAV